MTELIETSPPTKPARVRRNKAQVLAMHAATLRAKGYTVINPGTPLLARVVIAFRGK